MNADLDEREGTSHRENRRLARKIAAGIAAAVATCLVVAIPTDLIDTQFFSREIPPTWWSWPALLATSALTGVLVSTYVAEAPTDADAWTDDRRAGALGGFVTFFAVGCPVCNKLVLLALGTSGALQWFEPVQPVLSLLAIGLLLWAVRRRFRNRQSCTIPSGRDG